MKLRNITALVLFISSLAHAQNQGGADRGGNGGDALVCSDGVHMLDSVETRIAGHPVFIPSKVQTLRSKVELLLERVHQKDENLFNTLRTRSEVILTDAEEFEKSGNPVQSNAMFGEGELPNVPDEGATFIPFDCKIAQLIVRTKTPLPNQKLYSIRKDLWIAMSLDEQASAVLHESVYGYLVDSGINSSPAARWYNGLVISGEITNFKDRDLYSQMEKFKFPSSSDWSRIFMGFRYNPLNSVKYAPDGSIAKIENADVLPEYQFPLINGSALKVSHATDVVFDHGNWKSMSLSYFDVLDLDTLEVSKAWPAYVSSGGVFKNKKRPITVQATDIFKFVNKNILGISNVTLMKNSDGFSILQAKKFHWKIRPGVFTPVSALFSIGEMIAQRYESATIELDSNHNIKNVVIHHRRYKDMSQ